MTAETEQWLELYHRTSQTAAAAIHEAASMTSKENTREAFFSTHDDERISGYGEAMVHVRVPIEWIELGWARLDDEFELEDGIWEEHYAIDVARLKPEHFID